MMRVAPLASDDDGHSAVVVTSDHLAPYELHAWTNSPAVDDLTPWLPAVLPLAMKFGEPVHVAGDLDPALQSNSRSAQRVLSRWYDDLAEVAVTSDGTSEGHPRANGVGCFLSLGVDSFFSAKRHLDRITHLIFVQGFDIGLDHVTLRREVLDRAREAAAALGRPLLEVTTTLRTPAVQHVSWPLVYHGAALASCAHLLSGTIGEVIVPSSFYGWEELSQPWASSPILDPWWSGTRLTVSYDETHWTRAEKVAALRDDDVAMAHLRVCWVNRHGRYNCGECEKCQRTRLALRAAGGEWRCQTLEPPAAAEVRYLRLEHPDAADAARKNLAALRAMPHGTRDAGLERALRRAIAVSAVRGAVPDAARPLYERAAGAVHRVRGRLSGR